MKIIQSIVIGAVVGLCIAAISSYLDRKDWYAKGYKDGLTKGYDVSADETYNKFTNYESRYGEVVVKNKFGGAVRFKVSRLPDSW